MMFENLNSETVKKLERIQSGHYNSSSLKQQPLKIMCGNFFSEYLEKLEQEGIGSDATSLDDVVRQCEERGAMAACVSHTDIARKLWKQSLDLRTSPPGPGTNAAGVSRFLSAKDLDVMNDCEILEQAVAILEPRIRQDSATSAYLIVAHIMLNIGNHARAVELFVYATRRRNFDELIVSSVGRFVKRVQDPDLIQKLVQCFVDLCDKNSAYLEGVLHLLLDHVSDETLVEVVKKNPKFLQGDTLLDETARKHDKMKRLLECGAEWKCEN